MACRHDGSMDVGGSGFVFTTSAGSTWPPLRSIAALDPGSADAEIEGSVLGEFSWSSDAPRFSRTFASGPGLDVAATIVPDGDDVAAFFLKPVGGPDPDTRRDGGGFLFDTLHTGDGGVFEAVAVRDPAAAGETTPELRVVLDDDDPRGGGSAALPKLGKRKGVGGAIDSWNDADAYRFEMKAGVTARLELNEGFGASTLGRLILDLQEPGRVGAAPFDLVEGSAWFTFTARTSGVYEVELRPSSDTPSADIPWIHYDLRLNAEDVSPDPRVAGFGPRVGERLERGEVAYVSLDVPGDADGFVFRVEAGRAYAFSAEGYGPERKALLSLFLPDGSPLATGRVGDGPLEFVAEVDGRVHAVVGWSDDLDRPSAYLSMHLGSDHKRFGGGGHDDRLRGNERDNLMFGKEGDDALEGLAGADRLIGGVGDDQLDGGKGDDRLGGGDGDDFLYGGEGDDRSKGHRGVDVLRGEHGQDLLDGGRGSDAIYGGPDDDRLHGKAGCNLLDGGWGKDRLHGGMGRDVLDGGDGRDLLSGGGGRDVFVMSRGLDVVVDWRDGVDSFDVSGFARRFADLSIEQRGGGVMIAADGGGFFVRAAEVGDVGRDDFVF